MSTRPFRSPHPFCARTPFPSEGRAPALAVGVALLALGAGPLTGQTGEGPDLVAALDSAARAHVEHPLVAGVAVAVVQGGDTLLMRGFGYADLEFGTAMPADAVFEIGSVTKQFTAAAILQLAEEGRVDLDADITTYLPDFDAGGRAVPVRRLLDHTSGMKGYTEMPGFGDLSIRELPRDTMITLVEEAPWDFEPGEALIYNNSAYFFLGLIVERVSGMPYPRYVETRLFGPAGMSSSRYCDERAIVRHRANGYDPAGPEGPLLRAAYLDHTWPFSGGSLCSTVGDLVAWNRALHGGQVLPGSAYQAMITPEPLEDGTPVRYAKGLAVQDADGRRVIQHGGGINGFLSQLSWYPDDSLTVVVLQNSTGPRGPGVLAADLARMVLGEPEAPPVVVFEGDALELVGVYTGPARGQPLTVAVDADMQGLVLRPEGSPRPIHPRYQGELTWRAGGTLFTFARDGEGQVTELHMDHVTGHYVLERPDSP